MNAVGRVGTYIAQGVYTVSGPFHPFGGAVDIIVVEQEDGTFKSSPWYVKFGKFQGVLKRTEKRVAVAVNDGDATFHMYLDHKGEAYFLKDMQGDETGTLSLTEATSSGDESSHTYAREERGAESRAELGKEESEDDRGDDLELKLEGREASKQLIQDQREPDALEGEKISATQSHSSTKEEVLQEDIVSLDSGIETSGAGAGSEHQHIERLRHALYGTDGDQRKDHRPKSARDFLSDAACASHTVSTPHHPGFSVIEHGMTHGGRNASRNGMLIHCLLNLAVGRQPIDKSGTAVALVAKAALSSLERVVSGLQILDAGNQFSVAQSQPKLAEFDDRVSNPLKPPEDVVGESSSGEWNIRQEQDLLGDVLSKAITGGPRSYTGNTCNDVKTMVPVSSVASFSGPDADKVDTLASQPLFVGSCPQNFDASTTLEVKKVEIRDDAVVVQVQERLEVENHGRFPLEEDDVIEDIMIDRRQLEKEVFGRRDGAEQDGGHVESGGSQKITPEEYDADITVEVKKHLVEELKVSLEENENEDGKVVSGETAETTTSCDENGPETSIETEVASPGHNPSPAGIQGNMKKPEGVENERALGRTTSGKKVALASPVNVTNVSSPREKAAIELEMAWRQVMEKAATSLKGAPYANKKLHHSASHKKKSPTICSSHDKEDGSDEVQSERKSWGWLWGGSSAPQPKQGSDQDGGTRDGKRKESSVQGELLCIASEKLSNQGSSAAVSDGLTKGTRNVNKSLIDSQNNQAEAEGSYTDSGFGSGRTEGGKDGSDVSHVEGKEGHSELTLNSKAPPHTKRRFFGIFSGANPQSLSNASPPQRNENLRPLKSESSLEKAENMLDIYDQTWEKGFHPNQGFSGKGPPVRKEPEAKITEHVEGLGGEAEMSDTKTDESTVKQETVETVVDSGTLEDVKVSPNVKKRRSPSGSELVTEAATTLAAERDENSALLNQVFNQVSTTISDAEMGRASEPQSEISVGANWAVERQCDALTSDICPNGLKPISNTDVVILTVDGRILAAPIVDRAELEALEDNHEEKKELAFDVGKNYTNAGKSPRREIRFADPPTNPVEEPIVESDANRSLSNGVYRSPQREVIASSEIVRPQMDMQGSDCTGVVSAGNAVEGLKQLANAAEFEDMEGSQAKTWGASDRNSEQELESTLEISTVPAASGDDQGTINVVGPREMKRKKDDFRSPNVADDGDILDSSKQEMERYFSSKDLFDADPSTRFRRNMSIYLDAVGNNNDQGILNLATDEPNKSSEKTDPIGIPGAVRRARGFSPSDDPQVLRTSESLPNARHRTLDSDMASPRLTLSRSLGSAPLCALLTPDRSEVSSSNVLLTPGSEGNVAAGTERLSKDLQAEARPAEDKVESHKQNRATGFELSLCLHLLKERMGAEAAAEAFASEKITFDEFRKSGSVIAANDKLVVRVGDQYYPWVVASPIVLGILAFGQVLVSPDEGAIAVEKPIVTFDGQAPASPLTTVTSGGWNFWPFGSGRRPKTPEKENATDLVSKDDLLLEAALKNNVTKEYLQLANYYIRPRKIRTNSPSSQQLASLNLKEGSNKITFTFVTRVWGKQQVSARIYLWKWNTRIVISDVDGTITKSDVLGQVMPLVGKDWTQSGVARLFSAIKNNGYELMFLSARAISQAHLTRQFLENIKQDGEVLPDGPVVISPDGLFPSLYREVIRRAPHEFKIACLQDIKSLFPSESKPFYAGFGNRDTDELSYLKVGISQGKIFTINPKGEVVVNNRVDVKSYTSLHKLVDDMFPSMTVAQQEDYNEWNFWKLPLPDIEDELSVSSGGKSVLRKGVKPGKSS